eukprot:TRINITY_DN2219_c2_g1_i1.p1 TRINITY_DN2219_c2_g1~~TRINITY_DN2219_c2_g1_i1.p1  ORF type:complete len:755 (+),score=108.95 TRINITY_DN2219_c2_g1_i1:82-2265(+)
MFRHMEVLSSSEFDSHRGFTPRVEVGGYSEAALSELMSASRERSGTSSAEDSSNDPNRRTPGACEKLFYQQPDGLRVGSDGRFKCGSTGPRLSPLEDTERSDPQDDNLDRELYTPFDTEKHHTVIRSTLQSLRKYRVCEPSGDDKLDTFGEQSPLERASKNVTWDTNHLRPHGLPESCLPKPAHDEKEVRAESIAMNLHSIRVKILSSSGRSYSIELASGLDCLVSELIALCGEREQFEYAKIVFNDNVLDDTFPLSHHNVTHNSKLVLQIDDDTKVSSPPPVQKILGRCSDEILSNFIGVPLLSKDHIDTSFVQVNTGAAVAAAIKAQGTEDIIENWGVLAQSSGWRKSGKDLSAVGTNAETPTDAGIDNYETFEMGTPVHQYVDKDTARIVLSDRKGNYAAVYPKGVVPLSDHPARQWLLDYYTEHGSSRISEVDKMLWDARGREDYLRHKVVREYGPSSKPYSQYVRSYRSKRSFSPGATVDKHFERKTKQYIYRDSDDQFWVESKGEKIPVSDHPMRSYLIDFYLERCPDRVHEVDKDLWEFQWEEDQLRHRVIRSFGEANIPPYAVYLQRHNEALAKRNELARKSAQGLQEQQEVLRQRGPWLEVKNKNTNTIYYFNELTGAASWDPANTPFRDVEGEISRTPSVSVSSIVPSTVNTDFSVFSEIPPTPAASAVDALPDPGSLLPPPPSRKLSKVMSISDIESVVSEQLSSKIPSLNITNDA